MNNYAVVVGINHYIPPIEKGLKSLKGAIPDAIKVRDWLVTKGGVPDSNCHLITSTLDPLNPDRDLIDDAIEKVMSDVKDNHDKDADRFYFYFAGHGLGVELDSENNGLCVANWNSNTRDARALSSKDYIKKFKNEGLFKEIVVLMDCCRNQKLYFNPVAAPSITPLGPNRNPKYFVAYATLYQNEAFEADYASDDEVETRGVFTKVLLDALNGAAANGSAQITAVSLSNYLQLQVPIEAKLKNFSQEPDTSHNTNDVKIMYFS